MNSDPKSDCKQCTESKLGLVHSAHTQGLSYVHAALKPRARQALGVVSWRTGCRIVAPLPPCRALYRAPCRRPPVTIQKLYRNSNPCRTHCAPCRNAPTPYRWALGAVSQVVSRNKGRPSSTVQNFTSQHTQWQGRAPARRLSVS